jgi:heavy metal translocating P-type ATPase
LPVRRHIVETIKEQRLTFCCYGCRHIYELIAPELAQGTPLRQAMGRAGLDLQAPCCRGIIQGDPAEVAKNTLARLMLNAFLAMMVMVLSLALYSDFFFGEQVNRDGWASVAQGAQAMLQITAMLFATPAVLLLALPILEEAILTFQIQRRLTSSALIAAGSLAAYGLSIYATFTGQGHTYFETAVMILLLVTLGHWLDAKAQAEGNRALEALLAAAPAEATLIGAEGDERRVPIESLGVGDRIGVRPGESFAVDGRVVSGEGSVNEATITGEAAPAYKGSGSAIYAGTTNLDGSFVVEATEVGEERVVGKLARLLDEARLRRAPIERLADRVAAYFTPAVMILALGTFIFWSWYAGFEQGLLNGLAVLLIACPCALGIATPLAIWAGLGRAAQAGILIRDSFTLEKLARVRRIFFDKTGTLTTGQPTLSEIITNPQQQTGETPAMRELLLQVAASLEYHAEHPLARPIIAMASELKLPLLPVERFQAIPGRGVKGEIAGEMALVGSWRLVEQAGLPLEPELQSARQRLEQAGQTVIFIAWRGKIQGLLGLTETIRAEAASVLAALTAQRVSVQLLTGDSAAAGAALGLRLGTTVQSQLLPHEKVSVIEQAEAHGPTAMVGDGLNDAPALARASVGVALGCGADVTREAADVSLLGSNLAQVSWLLALARRVYGAIRWNLAWAFIYNALGVGLAMTGLLHPVLAAAAMVLSSALVVTNSLRIFRY